jgi:hypothetical protein
MLEANNYDTFLSNICTMSKDDSAGESLSHSLSHTHIEPQKEKKN